MRPLDTQRRLSILFVWGHLPPVIGGSYVRLERLIGHLCERGHRVTVIVNGVSGQPVLEHRGPRYVIWRVPPARPYPGRGQLDGTAVSFVVLCIRYALLYLVCLWAQCKVHPDIVVKDASTWNFGSRITARLRLRPFPMAPWRVTAFLCRAPLVVYFTEMWTLAGRYIRFCAAHAHALIVVDRYMTAILDRLGIEQPQHYLPVAIGDAPAALTTSSHRKPEVLFVGRLSAVRGCEQLVRAIPAILRAVPDARVIVVGDGAERPRLEAMTDDLGVREHVTFVGAVAPADVSFYYRRARVAVNPVRVPETGNATIEALAHGVPVVRSIVPGFDGFPVVDGFNGRHYPLDDIGALSSRIVDVITSSAWQEMSDSARTTARSFSIEESVSQLERILWSVIESRLQVDA